LSVTQLRSMLRMAVRLGAELSDIAHHANQQLCDDLPSGRFITAWFGVLDSASHTLASYSAGQAPLIVFRGADDSLEERDADNVPLGVVADVDPCVAAPIRMLPGDIFAVISDGFYEAQNPSGQMFGSNAV